jgi:hypothetical protein
MSMVFNGSCNNELIEILVEKFLIKKLRSGVIWITFKKLKSE